MTYQKRSIFKQIALIACLGSILITSSCQRARIVEPTTEPTIGSTTELDVDHKHILGVSFTDNDSGIWPPQALNATNISGVRNYAQGLQVQTLAASVMVEDRFEKSPPLNTIRGQRYASFEIDIVDEREVKGKEVQDVFARTTFYNYDSNATIDAWIDSNDTIRYTVTAAYETQPPENREEEAKAVALAKADLLSQGYSDVTSLKGTAMLAFPTDAEVASTGHNFYAERILYATFGQGNGEIPVYKALVNLSQNTVSDSGEIATY